MNGAAAFIAGFGLMENSPAVIIGAMLIAMLFGPIVGIAMALAEADLRLLRQTLAAEVVGAACVVGVGCFIGLSTRHLEIGSEILNRSAPNLLDLLIALVGGLAGAFTFLSSSLSSVIVGVAIATALVPPLTTYGILLVGPRTATGRNGCVLAILSQLFGDRLWSNDCLSAWRISPCRNGEGSERDRAAIGIRRLATRPRIPPVWHACTDQRTGNNAKPDSQHSGSGDRESSRGAAGRTHAGSDADQDHRLGGDTHTATLHSGSSCLLE